MVRLGQMFDETSRWSHWHIPEAHYLETWSDSRAFDGTVTIQQPLVEPLYNGKSAHEMFTILLGKPDQNSHEIVKGYWQGQNKSGNFERCGRLAAQRLGSGQRARSRSTATGASACRRSRHQEPAGSKSSSVPIRPSATALSRIMAGCRNCPSRKAR